MFKKIVLAYDGSDHAALALRKAADLALLCKAELHLLGVVSSVNTAAILQADAPYILFDKERDFIEAALADAAHVLGSQGLNVKTSVLEGSPADVIANHAQTVAADLVIIGHSEKGLLTRWLEGSIGAALLRHLPCNLLIATES